MTHSPRNLLIIYASGSNTTGKLFVLVSADFGDTWQTIEMEDGPTGIREVLYFGTNNGVYSYTFGKQ